MRLYKIKDKYLKKIDPRQRHNQGPLFFAVEPNSEPATARHSPGELGLDSTESARYICSFLIPSVRWWGMKLGRGEEM